MQPTAMETRRESTKNIEQNKNLPDERQTDRQTDRQGEQKIEQNTAYLPAVQNPISVVSDPARKLLTVGEDHLFVFVFFCSLAVTTTEERERERERESAVLWTLDT